MASFVGKIIFFNPLGIVQLQTSVFFYFLQERIRKEREAKSFDAPENSRKNRSKKETPHPKEFFHFEL
jgi:hypothetical protein